MAVKRLILLAAAVSLIAVSCDLFLLPKQDRDNPNDPDNPVAAMQGFTAVAVSRTEVLISVEVPNPEDESRLPAGFLIVRTQDKFPDGPDDGDGETITKSLDNQSGRIEVTDVDLKPDTAYRYAVWSFGADELSDHYTFSGADSAWTLDPSTDLETINDFSAWPYAIDQVYLEWRYSESGIEQPQSNLIVRKEGPSPPSDPYDGTTLYSGASKSSVRDYNLVDNIEYTYGIWPADEDGTPYQYGQTGLEPWFAATVVIAPVSISLQASDVVTVRDTDDWNSSPSSLQIQSTGSPLSAALIRFDLSGLEDKFIGTVVTGELLLFSQIVTESGVAELFRTVEPWDSGSLDYTWDDVTSEGIFYVDDGHNVSVFVDQAGEYFSWDIAQSVQYRADGFLLLGDTGVPADVSFDSGGGSGPRLNLLYFGEP
jgi:hypothetical protein